MTARLCIVIDTDPLISTDAGGHWWDVAVPEVSVRPQVNAARKEYEAALKAQRVGRSPTHPALRAPSPDRGEDRQTRARSLRILSPSWERVASEARPGEGELSAYKAKNGAIN